MEATTSNMFGWLRGLYFLCGARGGGSNFFVGSERGVEVFSRMRAKISQPSLPVINDHSLTYIKLSDAIQ